MRAALNAPIQGSAAEIIKKAMINIDHTIQTQGLPLKLVSQVHDELIFESPISDAEKMRAVVQDGMEQVAKLSVPLDVDVGVGRSWDEAH